MDYQRAYSETPAAVKIMVTGATIIGIGYGVYRYQKNKTEKAKEAVATIEGQTAAGVPGNVVKELNTEIKKNPSSVSYSMSQYKTFADTLEQYMKPTIPDGAGIVRIFAKMKTLTDVKILIAIFAIRVFQATSVSDAHLYNLPQWLANINMSTQVTNAVNAVLAKRKINFSF